MAGGEVLGAFLQPRKQWSWVGVWGRGEKEILTVQGKGARPTPMLVSACMMMVIEVMTHGIWVHSSTLIPPFTDLTKLNVIRKKNPKNLCTVKPITVIYMEFIPFVPNYRETS